MYMHSRELAMKARPLCHINAMHMYTASRVLLTRDVLQLQHKPSHRQEKSEACGTAGSGGASSDGGSASLRTRSLQQSQPQAVPAQRPSAALLRSVSVHSGARAGFAHVRPSDVSSSSTGPSSASSSWSKLRSRQISALPAAPPTVAHAPRMQSAMFASSAPHASLMRRSLIVHRSPEHSVHGPMVGALDPSDNTNAAVSSSSASDLPMAEVKDAYAAAEVLFQNVQVQS